MPRRKEQSKKVDDAGPEIVQEHPDDAPAGWAEVQEKLAASLGLSVLLVDGRQPPALVASNNNSICRAFQSSLEYVSLCDPYCGDAHRRALSAGSTVQYKCHAGLQCFTTPVEIGGEQNLAAIGGRAFVSGADYRSLADRFRAGELNDLLEKKPFENVIFAESGRLDQLSERLQKAARNFAPYAETLKDPKVSSTETVAGPANETTSNAEPADKLKPATDAERIVADRILTNSGRLVVPANATTDTGAFGLASDPDLMSDFKLLRARERSSRAAEFLGSIAQGMDLSHPGETYKTILAIVKQLLQAERASLMIFDEYANELVLEASEGLARGEGEVTRIRLGEGIAGKVLQSGKAQVTQNLETAGFTMAPAERNYKTKSFISYPIITKSGRKLGVLNVADKVADGKFEALELLMLEVLDPLLVGALERAESRQPSAKQSPAASEQLEPLRDNLKDRSAKSGDQSAFDLNLQHEVNRLRSELEHQAKLAEALRRLIERINTPEPGKTYSAILKYAKELVRAERLSLMVFDDSSNELTLKAAIGLAVGLDDVSPMRLGEGIAGKVLESGRPLVVTDLEMAGLAPASAARRYRTRSFISYPITLTERKIGVLNVTDKIAGGEFGALDLSLLELVGPQIAMALERAEWQERATQFKLQSITDPLTGLLNRRYLEERLTEELNRSQRYGYSMSCLMIDIDDFKGYNDRNGHQAGDVALRTTAHALKATLRSADVACRYGGEEFCILLPQTSLAEAGVIAERMRQRVAETDYPYGKSQPLGNVSVSIGVSALAKERDTAEKIVHAADRALYRAKHQGKNRIEFYVDDLPGSLTA